MTWPVFPQYLKEKADRFRDAVFLSDYGTERKYTYREVDEITDRMAGGLRNLGLGKGDRVALLHPNHSDFILAYFAVSKAGAVTVPINPLYTAREVLHILQDSGARYILSTEPFASILGEVRPKAPDLEGLVVKRQGESLLDALRRESGPMRPGDPPACSPDDLAFIFYTSGTTGLPKGVMLTHRNVTFGGANTAQNYGLRETDVTIACLPLVHIFANASPVFGSLNSGGRVVVMDRFQTEAVYDALGREGVTWFPGVPTMFAYLLHAFAEKPRRIPSLRMGLSGGASLSVEHLARFESLFQAPVLEVYGLTESTGLVTANPVYGVRKPGSIGVSVSGVQVRLVGGDDGDVPLGEVGELVFKGPNATPGYWKRPETTEETIREGWVHTGDLARQDRDGYFFMVGRKSELIISGGYNLYPREIEEVLYLHEEIAEAAVVGAPDVNLGEVPRAFVALKTGSGLTPEAIRDFCRRHLAVYKVPKEVLILDALPKNTTGKILKKELSSHLPTDRSGA
jgi:long-chain acyl-CoA synthetase